MAGAVPVRAIAERRVAQHFLNAGAVTPALAVPYEPTRFARVRAFARLKDHGVVKPAPGGWYIDPDAWSARRGARRKRAAILVGAAAAVGALIAWL